MSEDIKKRFAELLELPQFLGQPYQAFIAATLRPQKHHKSEADKILEDPEFQKLREDVKSRRSAVHEDLTDDFADEQLYALMNQSKDPKAKIAAIKEYNRLRQRVIRREELSLKGEAFKPVFNVKVNGKLKNE